MYIPDIDHNLHKWTGIDRVKKSDWDIFQPGPNDCAKLEPSSVELNWKTMSRKTTDLSSMRSPSTSLSSSSSTVHNVCLAVLMSRSAVVMAPLDAIVYGTRLSFHIFSANDCRSITFNYCWTWLAEPARMRSRYCYPFRSEKKRLRVTGLITTERPSWTSWVVTIESYLLHSHLKFIYK